ncbi:MAG: AAA family ATPase [Nonomuraea sp.]|nr:AAA family ATPase [Nonomuraea sp.]
MIIVITGISASGKSTVAELVALRLPRSAHVRGDTFRRMVVGGRAEMTPEPSQEALRQLDLRHRLTAEVADGYAEAGFTAVVQDVLLGEQLAAFPGMLRTRPVHVVVLAPSVEAVERRERERRKTGYGEFTVAQLDAVLRAETPPMGLWLDTSDQTPDETADEILQRLTEAQVG